MVEVKGNLWTYPASYRVITTNGSVRSNGEAVMGRGCAAEARIRYANLARELGDVIRTQGNIVWYFPMYYLLSFPVKHQWFERAELGLIQQSISRLTTIATAMHATFVMPRPSCGNGRLAWKDVKPLLQPLPDNVMVITW